MNIAGNHPHRRYSGYFQGFLTMEATILAYCLTEEKLTPNM